MQSIILISNNKEEKTGYINTFCQTRHISQFDKSVLTTEDTSIGIQIVKDIQKKLFVKPYQGEEKVLIIEDAEKLTTEAQNALLKVLEEPPVYVTIILSSKDIQSFLPTIISRCKVIELTNKIPTFQVGSLDDIVVLEKGTVGEKLALAESLAAKKEELPQWFESVIFSLHTQLLADPEKSREVADVLQNLQTAYNTFQNTNVNPRLLLEHTFLTIHV